MNDTIDYRLQYQLDELWYTESTTNLKERAWSDYDAAIIRSTSNRWRVLEVHSTYRVLEPYT